MLLQRLINQGLAAAQPSAPAEAVRRLAGVQAQDYPGAQWALGLRTGATRHADVERAFREGTFCRTWAMRGTLHFVAASDIHWLLALLAPVSIAGNARRYRQLALDEPTLKRSNALLAQALADGVARHREALMAMLEQQGISTAGQRAPYLLQHAALHGLICQSAVVKNDPLYSPLQPPAPGTDLPNGEAALAELTRRYFLSRGPATAADFGWWSGLPAAEVRRGMAALAAELVPTSDGEHGQGKGGQQFWTHRSAPASASMATAQAADAYLLPAFDEYWLGYKDRRALRDERFADRLRLTGGMVPPIMVYEGRVIGRWRRTLRKKAVVIGLEPFAALDRAQERAFGLAAERYATFIGLPVALG